MKFQIAIKQDTYDAIMALPTLWRADLLRNMAIATRSGLTAIEAGQLYWHDDNRFHLSFVRRGERADFDGELRVSGFVREPFDGIFYFDGMHEDPYTGIHHSDGLYRDPEVWSRLSLDPPDSDIEGYVRVDEDWLGREHSNPFIEKAYRDIDEKRVLQPFNLPDLLRSRFYRNLDQIFRSKRNVLRFGSRRPFDPALIDIICKRIVLDANYKNRLDSEPLGALIRSNCRQPWSLVIVNFIDELDPLSLAQREFITLMSVWAQKHCPEIKVVALDCIIRDIQGAELYRDELLQYHAGHIMGRTSGLPAPFSMLFGRLDPFWDEPQLDLSFIDSARLLDVDLFAGCRSEKDERCRRDERYRENLWQAMHGILSIAGKMAHMRGTYQARDFTGRNHVDMARGLLGLVGSTVVITLNSYASARDREIVGQACTLSILLGLPFITLVNIDDPERSSLINIYFKVSSSPGCEAYSWSELPDDDDEARDELMSCIREGYRDHWRLAQFVE